jgi:predicted nucleotidyltransferase
LQKSINHTKTRTGTVTLDYKAINQVSILKLQRWRKKVRKTEKILNFAKFQGHNSCKNQSITSKRELELLITKQYTKFQFYSCTDGEKKSGKLKKILNFAKF